MSASIVGVLGDAAIQSNLRALMQDPQRARRISVYLVEEDERPRTTAQNKLFRKLLRAFAQQQGGTVEQWHDQLVERFLGFDEVVTEDGYIRKVRCSTSALSVTEFTHFLNACLALASDNQVIVY